MIEWIHHRPPRACNETEIRVAERLKGLADSHHLWTVIWGYYYTDSRGSRREGDFLILGPTGGLLVLEVKSRLVIPADPFLRWRFLRFANRDLSQVPPFAEMAQRMSAIPMLSRLVAAGSPSTSETSITR